MFIPLLTIITGFLLSFNIASAHEAYVLPYDSFWSGIHQSFSFRAFNAIQNPHDVYLIVVIGLSVFALLILNFFFRRSNLGQKLFNKVEHYAHIGPHFVRITIAIALFFSALSNTFLGPELHESAFAFPQIIQILLFAISIMIAVGFLTEVAALIGVLIFVYSFFIFGSYVLTYLNHLGELIVLLLFGMRIFSVDKYLFGPLRHFRSFEKYETVIVRVMYGLALIYAGIAVKLLHPDLTISVINTWHLTKFGWLFPSDPLLITLGAGIVESLMGLFIIFGFEMHLAVLISLFYITLSLFYFRELVWPHLLLYGISFNLLLQPEIFTLDHVLFKHHRKGRALWKHSFLPHNEKGKSAIHLEGQ